MAIIDKPSDYFETVIYAGGTTDISSLDFQPDWVWAKKRTGAENHGLFDSVRGATKTINSNTTAAESTRSGSLTSFDSDGFTMGGSDGIISASGNNYVAWNWKAGTSFTNDASATGIGTIDSTGSVNTDAGFSIISWTVPASGSATVAHGLGKVPKMIISKSRSNATDWEVYHHKTGNANTNQLNTTAAANDNNAYNDTDPTSSVFSVTASGFGANRTMVSYCFAEKQGYSKFGSYTGNGNANDGTFVYTGFAPAFVMAKRTDSTSQWCMVDNKRPGYNIAVNTLFANSSEVEATDLGVNLLSNGFKEDTTNNLGASGGSYIYMAFAENPFVASNFNAATAR